MAVLAGFAAMETRGARCVPALIYINKNNGIVTAPGALGRARGRLTPYLVGCRRQTLCLEQKPFIYQ
jgi:hypothetical protein